MCQQDERAIKAYVHLIFKALDCIHNNVKVTEIMCTWHLKHQNYNVEEGNLCFPSIDALVELHQRIKQDVGSQSLPGLHEYTV